MLLKATAPHSLDVGGRMLAAGETADLNPADPVVADHLAAGHLTPVTALSLVIGEQGPEFVIPVQGGSVAPTKKSTRKSEET